MNRLEKAIDYIVMHEQIAMLLLIPFWGYMITFGFIDDLGWHEDLHHKNPFVWAWNWFWFLIAGTIMEVIILAMATLVIGAFLCLLMHAYIYVITFAALFIGLYIGRKIYVNFVNRQQ